MKYSALPHAQEQIASATNIVYYWILEGTLQGPLLVQRKKKTFTYAHLVPYWFLHYFCNFQINYQFSD